MSIVPLHIHLRSINEDKHRFSIEIDQPGQATAESSLPFSQDELSIVLRALEASEHRNMDFEEKENDWLLEKGFLIQENGQKNFASDITNKIGSQLFNALFPLGPIRDQLRKVEAISETDKSKIHVRIEFDHSVQASSDLAFYPWEIIHENGFFAEKGFLFSRYIRSAGIPTSSSSDRQSNILLISPRPIDLDSLSSFEEQTIRQIIQKADVESWGVEKIPSPTFADLVDFLENITKEKMPWAIHFDGHGVYGWRCNKCKKLYTSKPSELCPGCKTALPSEPHGYLAFEGKDRKAEWIRGDELSSRLLHCAQSQNESITSVILTACRSAVSRKSISSFNGVAQSLIKNGIQNVVAMAFFVEEHASVNFVSGFYKSLAKKQQLHEAVAAGRFSMMFTSDQWYRPVLYMRSMDSDTAINKFPSSQASQNYEQKMIGILFANDNTKVDDDYYALLIKVICKALSVSGKDVSISKSDNNLICLKVILKSEIGLASRNNLKEKIEKTFIKMTEQHKKTYRCCRVIKISSEIYQSDNYKIEFTNRKAEIEYLLNPSSQYMQIYAPSGFGKTYLLNKLSNEYANRGWTPLLINFEGKYRNEKPADFLQSIEKQIIKLKTDQSFDGIDGIAKAINKENLRVVFLIDDIDNASSEVKDWIISRLLPELESRRTWDIPQRVLVVGKKIVSEWDRLLNNNYDNVAIRFENYSLTGFRANVIDLMLRNQVGSRKDLKTNRDNQWFSQVANQIFLLSKGHPRCISNIIKHLDIEEDFGVRNDRVDSYFDKNKRDLIENYISPVVNEELLSHIIDSNLYELIHVFSILRGYNVNIIRCLAKKASENLEVVDNVINELMSCDLNPSSAIQTLGILDSANLFEGNNVREDGLYKFSPMIRQLVSLKYQTEKPVIFQMLNRWAFEMYYEQIVGDNTSLISDDLQARYMVEALYHQFIDMIIVQSSKSEIIDSLSITTSNYGSYARSNTGWSGQTSRDFVSKVKNDNELMYYFSTILSDNELNAILALAFESSNKNN